ncbi:MAG: BBP7 family outer membrane beta-barrel protein [Pirellulaceae bacterium]
MKATATQLSTMLTVLAVCVPLAYGQYGGAPAAPGYGPPAPGMGGPMGPYGPGPGMPNPYGPGIDAPSPYGTHPYMASPYAPSGAGYPPAGGQGAPAGYSPQQAMMQAGYANAGYYDDPEGGEPQMLPEGQIPEGYVPDDYSGYDMYGEAGPYDDMGQYGAIGAPYGGGPPMGGGGGGGGGGDDPMDVRRHRFWYQSELLLWARHKRMLPPLITTSLPGTPRNAGVTNPIASVLGFPSTTLLFGGNREGSDGEVGGAVDFGFWLDPPNEIGIGGRFWILGDDEQTYFADSLSSPVLNNIGFPLINAQLNKEDAQLIGYQGPQNPQQYGQATAYMANEIHGADAYVRLNMLHWFGQRRDGGVGRFHNWDMLVGYRYTQVNDLLTLHGQFYTLAPATTFSFTDHFRTKNQFHGGLLGLTKTVRNGRWSLTALGKVGIGNMHQSVLVTGTNSRAVGMGAPIVTPGGIFTQTTNIGKYNRDHFAYVPEFKIDVGYQVTDIFRVTAGYDFLYWSNVMMAGQQIDREVNRTLLSGGVGVLPPSRPAYYYRDTDFWAMGLNFSVIGEF